MTDDLHGVMRSATENLHPNIGKLTAGGIERGVRKRRNRRISQIAGAAASVTAVFAVVAAVGSPGHGAPANVSAAAGTTDAAAPASPGTPASTTAGTPTAPAAAPVTGEDMAKWLQQAVQPYNFTDEKVLYKAGTDDAVGAFATLRIGYASGTGSLSLNIAREPWSSVQGGTVPYVTSSTLADGSHLMVFDGPEWPAGNGDPSAKRLDVAWYRTDGTLVDLMVLNEAQEKGATTATDLGLTLEQATKVVQSPVWDKAIASVLAKPAPTSQKVPSGAKSSELAKKNAGPGSGQSSSPAAPPAH